MSNPEVLSNHDHEIIATTTRDYSRGRLAELAGQVLDGQDQLRAMWRDHERRWGPELDETARHAVSRALGIQGVEKI